MFTNNLVLFKFQIFNQDISWWLASTKEFGSFHMVIPEPEHQDHSLHSLESSSVDHRVLDRVDLKMEDRQEDLSILV